MADVIDTITPISGTKRIVSRFTNVYVDTGETAAIKIDKSTLIGPDGTEPTSLVIEEISWDIQGYTSVRIDWDHTTDDEIVKLGAGSGSMSWVDVGGLKDPGSAGGTGDVVFTTSGAVAGNSYTITIVARLKD